MRILLAIDFDLLRHTIRSCLVQHFGQVTVGETATAENLMAQLEAQPWDVLLLDMHLHQENELGLLHRIRAMNGCLPVILMSFRSHHPFAIKALQVGARGYLTKDDLPEQLPHAISKVINGGRYINPVIAETMAIMLTDEHNRYNLHEKLSQRELMIMLMLSQGITSKRIANRLNLSINTVSTYRCRALKKLNMQSNAEFIQYAIKNDLLH